MIPEAVMTSMSPSMHQININTNTLLECCGICNVCIFPHSLQEANLRVTSV